MLVSSLLDRDQVLEMRHALVAGEWTDGRATAGHLSQSVKQNRQLDESHPLAIRLGTVILDALERNPEFMSFALPAKVVPPLFNAYRGGENYGRHIDGAIRPVAGHAHRVRTDISATLFLSEPDDYDGGELVIEEMDGGRTSHKHQAGSLLLYPSVSVHYVSPVTRGERLAAFFWIQSMVRETDRRLTLFNLDCIVRGLRVRVPADPAIVDLTGHYHNLLRLWADVI